LGAQGVAGQYAAQGIQGATGAQGYGYAQSQGIQGAQGVQGLVGGHGSQGTTGRSGVQGYTGAQGAQGAQGGGVSAQYVLNAIAASALASTDDLPEGVSNKYFTTARVSYNHVQGVASSSWVINHNLGFYPNLTVQDSAGNIVEGEITYTTVDSITVTFSTAFSGEAYLS